MLSYWAYILVAPDKTGKTSFQKYLLEEVGNKSRVRLKTGQYSIQHPVLRRYWKTIFLMSRSFHEKKARYKSVKEFFKKDFFAADVCILSSHPHRDEIEEMIWHLHAASYNVAGMFWSNAFHEVDDSITNLGWQELLWFDNKSSTVPKKQQQQIRDLAIEFCSMLVRRAANS